MKARAVRSARIRRVRGDRGLAASDRVAVEEPLEVRIRHGPPARQAETSLGLLMRTPGHDVELVAGLLLGEGIVSGPGDIVHTGYCADPGEEQYHNVVVAELAPHVAYAPKHAARALVATSACGVCGRAALETLSERKLPPLPRDLRVAAKTLRAAPQRLRRAQDVFRSTGGLHAAALLSADGDVRLLREDVGRHNAVDKVVGARLLEGDVPLDGAWLLVSGRAGYEILEKARAAGIGLVAAIGAPSSLAVDLAKRERLTLVGFLKRDGFNVYSAPWRVV